MRARTIVVLSLLAACTARQQLPVPRTGPMAPGDDRQRPQSVRAAAAEWSNKPVSAKEDPNRLIAKDRSSCTVSEKKYRETNLGESVYCAWSQ
ncbi:MAG: hypothetical protein ACRENU_04340 [Gemmatimonadaceae bacterium]